MQKIPRAGRRSYGKRFPMPHINRTNQMRMRQSTIPWEIMRKWKPRRVRKTQMARPTKSVTEKGKQMIRTGRLSGSGGMSVSRRGVGV